MRGPYLRPEGLWNDSGALRAVGMRPVLTIGPCGFLRSSSSRRTLARGALLSGLTTVSREASFAAAFASIMASAFR